MGVASRTAADAKIQTLNSKYLQKLAAENASAKSKTLK